MTPCRVLPKPLDVPDQQTSLVRFLIEELGVPHIAITTIQHDSQPVNLPPFPLLPHRDSNQQNPAPQIVKRFLRSELLAIEAGLEAILNESNYGVVWILSDSRSSIQHLKDWNNVGDRTGISILKLLRHIGVDHEVHLQRIPSHVDIYGNEVADNLAKQRTVEPLC
ncbi:hypothetical protein AVEN_262055-1 [Araneus ventricosus]|uniref:RNase H type-1 domain-containing protein n=1 Tax=Araneus ventricosus TaxID=182803 RepID=A0A4Y2NMD2_ARAVE|nr:hypothetical protein AVEN_262055-1 [Araneus ventricosus]